MNNIEDKYKFTVHALDEAAAIAIGQLRRATRPTEDDLIYNYGISQALIAISIVRDDFIGIVMSGKGNLKNDKNN